MPQEGISDLPRGTPLRLLGQLRNAEIQGVAQRLLEKVWAEKHA